MRIVLIFLILSIGTVQADKMYNITNYPTIAYDKKYGKPGERYRANTFIFMNRVYNDKLIYVDKDSGLRKVRRYSD